MSMRERLEKREHHFRNAVEGEYDADLLRQARFRIDDLESALGAIARLETIDMKMGAEVQLTHVLGVLDGARNIAAEALDDAPSTVGASELLGNSG